MSVSPSQPPGRASSPSAATEPRRRRPPAGGVARAAAVLPGRAERPMNHLEHPDGSPARIGSIDAWSALRAEVRAPQGAARPPGGRQPPASQLMARALLS
eukprot:COSAG01_NODE_1505_length_10091_cov_18.350781_6_plen_100_part_00